MSLVRFTEVALARRCAVTGRSQESVADAVVNRQGSKVILDDAHPAYPSLRGLGDVVATVTAALGVKSCGGCKQRQEWANEAFPL